MSQRPAPSDPFVPFAPVSEPAKPSPAPSPTLKTAPRSDTVPPFTPLEARAPVSHGPHREGHSGQPVITMQRDGDRVVGIRIECVCGQVIELACNYGSNPLAP
ncbi:MAG TPA: hypothetical protein VNH84_01320 [Candidatus Saccharimonadales bacterium]|nr:hypothetical protein [Candidatus Saccharimonadales bacterium]